MNIAAMRIHIARLRHQLGKRMIIGSRKYRVRGYLGNQFAREGHHEPYMKRVFQGILKRREGAFIDVGVNVGQSLISILAIDPERAYVGFEPQIACCFFVNQFIVDNELSQARILPLALWDSNGTVSLFSRNSYDSMASILPRNNIGRLSWSEVALVTARVGDEVIDELKLGNIAAIKVDVEGAEFRVLSGIRRTLRKYRPDIVFEVLPNYHGHNRVMKDKEACARGAAAAKAIWELFEGMGYGIGQIDDQGDERAIDFFDLDEPGRYVGSNYIARSLK